MLKILIHINFNSNLKLYKIASLFAPKSYYKLKGKKKEQNQMKKKSIKENWTTNGLVHTNKE